MGQDIPVSPREGAMELKRMLCFAHSAAKAFVAFNQQTRKQQADAPQRSEQTRPGSEGTRTSREQDFEGK